MSDKCTHHQILFIWLALFTLLSCIFPHLLLPKSSGSTLFPTFGFLSCALPEYSYPASHNVSHTPRQQPTSILKIFGQWLMVVFTLSQWGWGSPGTALRGARLGCPFLWIQPTVMPLCFSAPVKMSLWWAHGSCDGSANRLSGYYLDFCALLWVCRWALLTQPNIRNAQDAKKTFKKQKTVNKPSRVLSYHYWS